MANPYANLRPGDTCLVEGEVEFSHILRPYEGEELQKQIERAKKAGQIYPPTTPYTKITLKNATIHVNGQPTPFDQVMAQNLYIDDARIRDGRNYTIELINKGKYAPNFGYFPLLPNGQPDFQHGELITPKGELKTGQRVRVIMKVFSSRNGNGCGIDAVLCLGEPEYYQSNTFDYSAYGMFFTDKRTGDVNEDGAFVNPYAVNPDEGPVSQTNNVNPYAFNNINTQMPNPYGSESANQMASSQPNPVPDPFGQTAGASMPGLNVNPYVQTVNQNTPNRFNTAPSPMQGFNPGGVNTYGSTDFNNSLSAASSFQNDTVNRYSTPTNGTQTVSENGPMSNIANTASVSGGITPASVMNASTANPPAYTNEKDPSPAEMNADDPNKTY